MFGVNRWWTFVKALVVVGLVLALTMSFVGDRDTAQAAGLFSRRSNSKSSGSPTKLAGKISETSPPEIIQKLRQELENYQPQVSILSPKPNDILQDDTINVRFQVRDLPLFKNEGLGLGPHLHVFVDNQPYQAVYDASEPLVLRDLAPGTHTIRAFASRPWHESFKMKGLTLKQPFIFFAKTQENSPNSDLPLLTYSRPQGSYGAEPIMLDFYLTNAPLHLVAQENAQDDIADWRIRCTINDSSFVLDRWQPIYLKGFKPGKNWVQLEYLDEKGNVVKNAFNNTVRLITYEPNGKDTLSKLTRGDLSLTEARGIIDPNYKLEITAPEPTPTPIPEVTPVPTPTETPTVEPVPEAVTPSPVLVTPSPEPTETPQFKRTPEVTTEPSIVEPETTSQESPEVEPSPSAEPSVEPEPESIPEKVKPQPKADRPTGGFFNRFRRPASKNLKPSPSATPVLPRETDLPTLEPSSIEPAPESEEPLTPNPLAEPSIETALPSPTDELAPSTPEAEVQPSPEAAKVKPSQPQPSRTDFKKYFDRFRRPTPSPKATSTPQSAIEPKVTESPTEMTAPEPINPEASPEPEVSSQESLTP